MALPNVNIKFSNGALGTVTPSADNVVGLMCTASAVSGKFELEKAYCIYKSTDLEAKGITATNNTTLYKEVSEFYAQAGEGAELWIYGVGSQIVEDILDEAETFISAANGRLRCIVVASSTATSVSAEYISAVGTKAQEVAEWATESLYAPMFFILPVQGMEDAESLPDLTTMSFDRVGFFIGDTVADGNGAMGLIGGRVAECAVQEHIGRVKDGALSIAAAFVADEDPSVALVETINNKGYITFRTFVGKSGYFFSDDCLACAVSNDYHSIARRRTVDKAYREAYGVLIDHINEEIPVNGDGTMVAYFAKAIESEVIADIYNTMTSEGNLSVDESDSSDKGVKCTVDTSNNIVSTNTVNVEVKVRPYGYAKYISVELGFQNVNS